MFKHLDEIEVAAALDNLDRNSRTQAKDLQDHTQKIAQLEKTVEDFRKIFGEKADLNHVASLDKRLERLESGVKPATTADTYDDEDTKYDSEYEDEDEARLKYRVTELEGLLSDAYDVLNNVRVFGKVIGLSKCAAPSSDEVNKYLVTMQEIRLQLKLD